MKTITTNIYSFDELSPEAQLRAIFDHIEFEIEVVNSDSPYYYLVEQMEKMQTPWFLGEAIFSNEKESIVETIKINDYHFYDNGKICAVQNFQIAA